MDKRQKERYKSWSKYLKLIDIHKDQDFFLENFDKIDFSFTNTYGIRFFRDRYSFFLTEEEIETLQLKNKKILLEKRGSMYDVENVMRKKNVSFEEAEVIVNERKSKTNGSFENFVKRHGDDAVRRFEIFKNKSLSSLENFKIRYGDKGEERWQEYLNSRDSSSLNFHIKKHGEKEGVAKYKERIENLKERNSLEGFKKVYGEEEGERYFKEIAKKKTITLDFYIKKYGEEEGLKIYLESNYNKGKSNRLDYYIEKYGEEDGLLIYNDKLIRRSPIFIALKNKHGEDEAYKLYEDYRKTKEIEPNIKNDIKSRYVKRSISPHSKESISFFKELENKLGRQLQYSKNGGELRLFDEMSNKLFVYDCYDQLTNTLIEFQGVAFHPKKDDFEWVGAYGQTYDDVYNKDLIKKEFAEKSGYNFITIWSDEVNSKSKMITKVEDVKNIINNEDIKNRD